MLEIYNEQVRDLLTKDNPKGGLQVSLNFFMKWIFGCLYMESFLPFFLKVRQNPKLGSFFVQGLKKVAVGSYKEIEKRTEEGEQ